MLAHSVFFSLNDRSEAAIQKMLGDCRKYLTSHPGILFFACGTPNQELTRPVNDRDFEVALHIVFDKANWRQVRVFDADVESHASSA
jgi:hypothetical protein